MNDDIYFVLYRVVYHWYSQDFWALINFLKVSMDLDLHDVDVVVVALGIEFALVAEVVEVVEVNLVLLDVFVNAVVLFDLDNEDDVDVVVEEGEYVVIERQ